MEPDSMENDPSTEYKDNAKEDTSLGAKERTDVIQHIIKLCGFCC